MVSKIFAQKRRPKRVREVVRWKTKPSAPETETTEKTESVVVNAITEYNPYLINAQTPYDVEYVIARARYSGHSREEVIQIRKDMDGIRDWAAALARFEDLNWHVLYSGFQATLQIPEEAITAAFDRLPAINWAEEGTCES